ncbi:hypothetical protein JOF28_000682 [Leucobacter exalbidus]|uniref:Lipoprotein n=1 Tax=Leucobacter exalbidus TaxID=662960 RepID=A0A940PLR5_9MICO|nr:hypothetical protein [Leucobacter exalbidus]MBP1325450.1 hypothetical protein [Leucobacter exalbidus]
MTRLRYVAASALTLASVVLLTGCAGQQAPLADLAGERTSQDELPQLSDYAYDLVNTASSKYVGEYEGTSLWLALGIDPDTQVCLIVAPGNDRWTVSCGGIRMITSNGEHTFEVVPDGASPAESATRVSENVHAR